MSAIQAFVPKNRRPKFDLIIRIIDLNNVPLVSGTSFVKWHLPHSTSAEHRGRTDKRPIKDHKVVYDYCRSLSVRLTIEGKTRNLLEQFIHFEVVQEYSSGGRGPERIALGHVKLNLAEYVEASELEVQGRSGLAVGGAVNAGTNDEGEEAEGVVRRYLMQDSKINSTLKVGIFMRQVDGDREYITPPLRTAPVFGGIAGIMAGEQGDTEDVGHIPSLSNKSRELGELQDMYRRTLTASWAAQPGELKADECIEDIFAGGDGWGDKNAVYPNEGQKSGSGNSGTVTPTGIADDSGSGSGSDTTEMQRHPSHRRRLRRRLGGIRHMGQGRDMDGKSDMSGRIGGGTDGGIVSGLGVKGRGSLEQQARTMEADTDRRRVKQTREVDELEIRDDLRCWRLPGN
ncbi:N-terminal C2 in EEIG1 and EHBP1 proteins-domain-containing protein [Lineolata rhizophorae]|uniref:N-terminal C2 in EEIG1 and EHBP1 proteins-domain-containing protein n=1 Tax=Lineolata rhizophorae TaxID=578093 RepID=A0A6A6NVT0_9PEZI|nr:N-terminal C2 in EEIG1 and EHBP1 proteins-domain-containing protein [Lineolata rhizophorae]